MRVGHWTDSVRGWLPMLRRIHLPYPTHGRRVEMPPAPVPKIEFGLMSGVLYVLSNIISYRK